MKTVKESTENKVTIFFFFNGEWGFLKMEGKGGGGINTKDRT